MCELNYVNTVSVFGYSVRLNRDKARGDIDIKVTGLIVVPLGVKIMVPLRPVLKSKMNTARVVPIPFRVLSLNAGKN